MPAPSAPAPPTGAGVAALADTNVAGGAGDTAGALVALQQVDEAQRQAVLDEWAARKDAG